MSAQILAILVYFSGVVWSLRTLGKGVFRPSFLFFVFFLLIYGIGSIFYPHFFPGQLDSDHIFSFLLFFILVLLGIQLGDFIFYRRLTEYRPSLVYPTLVSSRVVLLLALAVSIFSAILWYVQIGTIPALAGDVEVARVETARGTYHLRQMTSFAVPALLFFTILVAKSRRGFVFLVIATTIEVLILASQGYRSFPLSLIFLVLITYELASPSSIKLKLIVSMGIVVLLFASAFSAYRFFSAEANAQRDIDTRWVVARDIFVRPLAYKMIVEEFPNNEPFQKGAFYLKGFGFLIPGRQKSPGQWLKEDIFELKFAGDGLNPGLIGEVYLNFGHAITFIFALFYGVFLSICYRIAQMASNPLVLVMAVITYFYSILAIAPGFATSFLPILWFCSVSILTYFAMRFLYETFAGSSENNLSRFVRR